MFFHSVKFSVDANIKIWTGFWSKTSRYWSKTSNRQFLKVPSYFPGVFKSSESSEILPWRFYKFRKFRATSLEFLQIPKVPRYFPGVFTSSEIELWQKFELFILMFSDFIYCFFIKKSPKKPPGLRAFWIGIRAGRLYKPGPWPDPSLLCSL